MSSSNWQKFFNIEKKSANMSLLSSEKIFVIVKILSKIFIVIMGWIWQLTWKDIQVTCERSPIVVIRTV